MNLRKAFSFKVKEVIGYIEYYDGEDDDNPIITSVDIYLSGGRLVTVDLKDDPIDSKSLADTLGFDPDYWSTLYSKNGNQNVHISLTTSEIKSVSTKYNPYA